MIVIVDYGLGNVGSIRNMFTRSGVTAVISGEQDVIGEADKLVLPGVGSFDTGMTELRASGLVPVLAMRVTTDKVPVLGICLGMQMMGTRSDEGTQAGLGWLAMDTVQFDMSRAGAAEKVPHMGWSEVEPKRADQRLPLDVGSSYYFAHSYHPRCSPELVLATTTYGYEFPCAVQQDNVIGVQFHPEKSHRAGVELFRRFGEQG